MEKTGQVNARFKSPGSPSPTPVPVEVRDLKSIVRARGLAGLPLDLAPGRYVVTATTPDGREWTTEQIVNVSEGKTEVVDLVADSDDAGIVPRTAPATTEKRARPQTRDFWRDLFRRATPDAARQPSASDDAASSSGARPSPIVSVIRGRWLANWMSGGDGSGQVSDSATGFTREVMAAEAFELSPRSDVDTLIEIAAGGKASYFTIPFDDDSRGRPTQIRIVPDETHGANVKFEFENKTIHDFLAYVTRGQSESARTIARSLAPQAQALVAEDTKSPLGAIIGAYVLLRANEMGTLDKWTEQLLERHGARMPDALPLRVETLARLGRHEDVIAIGLGAEEVPRLPWFRSGVGYLCQRLEQYINFVTANPQSGLLTEQQLADFRTLLRGINRLSWSLDDTRTVCVFRGLEPVDSRFGVTQAEAVSL